MSSIHLALDKIKLWGRALVEMGLRDYGMALVLALVAVLAFGLGRLSAMEEIRPLITVSEAPQGTRERALPLGGQFVASRTGTVYYYPWCGGAQQIPVGSQLWFNSENAAQKAGFAPAKNCRGLAE